MVLSPEPLVLDPDQDAGARQSAANREAMLRAFGQLALQTLLTVVLIGAITHAVVQQLGGRKPGIGECLSIGFRRLLPILGTALVVGILIGLGTLLCVVPGIILHCIFWVAVPVALIEGGGVGNAMSRSSFLTRGSRVDIFLIWLCLAAIGIGAGLIIGMIGSSVSLAVTVVLTFLLTAVLGAWQAIAVAVSYHDLRAIKEQVDVTRLAAVFD